MSEHPEHAKDGFNYNGSKLVHTFQGNSAANTILITNNYSNQNGGSPMKGTGITIVTTPTSESSGAPTVVLDRINICINNHYDGQMQPVKPQVMSIKKERAEEGYFETGDDVLVRQDDGRFFFGTVIVVAASQCLVKYDDDTKKWANFGQLKKFGAVKEADSGPLCVTCKKTHKETVEVCDGCGRGYHPRCSDGSFKKSGVWVCHKCEGTYLEATCEDAAALDAEQQIQPNYIEKLPYNRSSLHWDAFHKENKEQKYCYCGGRGNWFRQMLQCSRCQQWFHERCTSSIQFPLFAGDRFYVFVCRHCNLGNEFLQRLEMKWADLVQITLYNLTIDSQKTFFHIDDVIIRYLTDMKTALQVPHHMANDSKMRDEVLLALGDYTRFKNGKELKKSPKLWALRAISPPNAPSVILPNDGNVVTEKYIKDMCANINFVHYDIQRYRSIIEKIRSRINGRYLLHDKIDKDESGDDSCTYDSEEEGLVKTETEVGDDNDDTSRESPPQALPKVKKRYLRSSHDSYSETSRDSPSLKKPNEPPKLPKSKEKLKKGEKRKRTEEPVDSSNDDDTSSSSRLTLDFLIPPLQNYQGPNNPFSSLFDSRYGTKREPTGDSYFAKNAVRLVRTVKRRLSAKDIVIGPNQEIKRKKTKRKLSIGNVEVISTTRISSSSSAILPFRSSFKEIGVSSSSSTSQSTSRRSSTASLSGSLPDLPSSSTSGANGNEVVKSESYFSQFNSRGQNGDSFKILGRRIIKPGKLELLGHWDF